MSTRTTQTFAADQLISFVITSVGRRDGFIEAEIIPGLRRLGVPRSEIVVVGRYQGSGYDRLVELEAWPKYFYKPFQRGVEAARGEWVVELDDDMTPTGDWWPSLVEGATRAGAADVYGFTLLRPDGTIWSAALAATRIPDKWVNVWRYRAEVDPQTFFGCALVRRDLLLQYPMPPFMSGDRAHGLQLGKAMVARIYLPNVRVIHHGLESGIGRCATEEYEQTIGLRRRLGNLHHARDRHAEAGFLRWFDYAQRIERRRKRLAIFGGFGCGNVGDELIAGSMIQSFRTHELHIVSDQLQEGRTYQGVPVLSTPRFRETSADFDMLLFGGGDILHGRYVRALLGATPRARLGCPVIVYAAGIPFPNWLAGAEPLVEGSYLVTLRDPLAVDMFAARFPDIPVQLLPDPVFLTPPLGAPRHSGKLVIIPRFIPPGWRRSAPDDINAIQTRELTRALPRLRSLGFDPQVLVFERRDLEWLSPAAVPSRLVAPDEAVLEIATAEIVVTSRIHGAILAATQDTPFVVIDHQSALAGVVSLLVDDTWRLAPVGLDLVAAIQTLHGRPMEIRSRVDSLRELLRCFHRLYLDRDIPIRLREVGWS